MSTTPTNGYLHELHEASAHLVHFIKNFLEVFPEWKGVDVSLIDSHDVKLDSRDDRFEADFLRVPAVSFPDLPHWRVLRWTVHPLLR